jgi:hypothetical protein
VPGSTPSATAKNKVVRIFIEITKEKLKNDTAKLRD